MFSSISSLKCTLRTKLFLSIIILISINIAIVAAAIFFSLQNITVNKEHEVQGEFSRNVSVQLQRIKEIALTNATALATNSEIINALRSGERRHAVEAVDRMLRAYESFSKLGNVKIHIHTAEPASFYRSWKPDVYGDALGSFRTSLNHVKTHRSALSTIETGRAGLLIRGIVPILDKGEYLGSVEFIQNFSALKAALYENYGLQSVLLTPRTKGIAYFNEQKRIGSHYLSHQHSDIPEKLFSALQKADASQLQRPEYFTLDEYFITPFFIEDFQSRKLGILLLIDTLDNVQAIVKEARQDLFYQLLIMAAVGLAVMGLLMLTLKTFISDPIERVVKAMQQIKQSLSDKKALAHIKSIPVEHHDEIGDIANAFNRFTEQISLLYGDLARSNKITEEYAKAVDAGSIVSRGDLNGHITYVNDALCRYTGYSRDELIGKPHSIFRHPNTPKIVFRQMWKSIENGNIWHGLFKNRKKDGSTFYANITIVPLKNERDVVFEYLALRTDVTELVKSKKELKTMFQTDALTSLGNRFKLMDEIKARYAPFLAVIDIKSFKEINDFYGFKNGDQVIIGLSNMLFAHFDTDACMLYRLQGDTFAIVADGEQVVQSDFTAEIQAFIDSVHKTGMQINEYQIDITLSCGLCFRSEETLESAELALQTAKKENITMVIYNDQLKTSLEYKNNLLWSKKVKQALQEGRIVTHYQAIYNNVTHVIDKYETLVRLKENGEFISPFFFLQIAKRSRLYPEITRTVISQAIETFKERGETFSVNLSAEDIVNTELIREIFSQIDRSGIGQRLVFEIVESESIQSFDVIEEFIAQAKARGCKIAIDDFGTGYSNFEYLIKMQTDFIKIDGSLIKNIDTDQNLYNVVETIVAFAKKNGIETIAEFVASESIQETVKRLEIDYSQGYLLGKPGRLAPD